MAKVLVADALEHPTNADIRMGMGISNVWESLPASLDAPAAVEVAMILADALEHTQVKPVQWLAGGLGSLAPRLDAAEAAKAAIALFDALEQEKDAQARTGLAEALVSMAARLDAADAAKVCRKAMRTLLAARATTFPRDGASWKTVPWDGLLTYLEPGISRAIVRALIWDYCARGTRHLAYYPSGGVADSTYPILMSIMSDRSPPRRQEREARIAAAKALKPGPDGERAAAAIAAEPYPCRLTTPELVELLKMPTCASECSRAVLDQLGNIHGRKFASRGEFIRFARETGLHVDLTTPPQRPDPREPLERLLDPPAADAKP